MAVVHNVQLKDVDENDPIQVYGVYLEQREIRAHLYTICSICKETY